MGVVGDALAAAFVISVGDNFYEDGLTGVNDTAFDTSFSDIYTAPSLDKPWHVGQYTTYTYTYNICIHSV